MNNAYGPMANVNFAGFATPGLPNQGYKLWLALVIMIACSGLTVAGRLATRISSRQVGADDVAIVAALVSCIIQTTLWALSVRTGYGADYLLLNEYQRRQFNMWWFLGSIFYPLTIALFKTSVILLNKRIFIQRSFQTVCWITLMVNGCWALGNILGWIFQCLPVPSMWGAAKAVTCFNQDGLWISIVVWDVTIDAWILAMSIPLVWQLNLRFREKVMLMGVFCLGAIVIVFSVMSCSAVMKGLETQSSEKNKVTFALANLFQVLESNMGIIGACLPVMRQPLKQAFPRMFGTSRRTKSSRPDFSDDRFVEQYMLQSVSHRHKCGGSASWNDVSGPHGSGARKSDELEIIDKDVDAGQRYHAGGYDADSDLQLISGIRKDVVVSVNRV